MFFNINLFLFLAFALIIRQSGGMQFLYNLSWGLVIIILIMALSLGYTGFFFFGSDKKNQLETGRIPWAKRLNVMTIGALLLVILALAAAFVKLVA